jgi:hypothetical protein
MHSQWREIVVNPADANCIRCQKPLHSVWRKAYPADGSRCKAGQCVIHAAG